MHIGFSRGRSVVWYSHLFQKFPQFIVIHTVKGFGILGISELKWMGMGEFNSDDHYIYCCRQESLRRNGVAFIVNKSPKWSTWVQSQKWRNDLGSFPRQTIQYHNNLRLHPSHWWWRSWSRMVLWRPTRSSGTNTPKDVLFIIGDWNAKVGSQEIPGVTGKFGFGVHNEAGQS